jgi:hypothetical protein
VVRIDTLHFWGRSDRFTGVTAESVGSVEGFEEGFEAHLRQALPVAGFSGDLELEGFVGWPGFGSRGRS